MFIGTPYNIRNKIGDKSVRTFQKYTITSLPIFQMPWDRD